MDITLVLRKFRKSIAGFTILALIASFAFSGLAFAYTDDDEISSWADDYVTEAADEGWMTGNDDGSFDPQGTITRQELAKVLVLAFLGEDYVDEDYDAGYTDADDISSWALAYVNTAELYEFMTGTGDGTTFDPTKTVNRATMAQALVNAAMLTEDTSYGPTFDDVDEDEWYYGAVETAYLYQVVDGKSDTEFDPTGEATREAVAKMAVGALSPEMRDMSEDDDSGSDSDATLEIEVSDDTPEADTLPKYATSVEVAAWDFTAEDGDVEIDDLTVHQYGISSLSTVTLYLYEGTERLTSGKSVHSTDFTADFNNLNIEVEEGDTVTLTVRADLGATGSTGEMGLEIVDADALDIGEADVDGDFPLQAEKFSLATEAVGNITIETNGSISNPQVGEDSVTVAKFKISSDSTTTSYSEDATLTELGLYLSGTVSADDVENFELYVSGEDDAIATADGVDGKDVVRFVIEDGYTIEKGGSKAFTVKADFNTGRTSDTVKIYVDEDTDVVAIGGSRGYGMNITRTDYDGGTCDGSTNECSHSTLEGGDITITSNGPAATDVAVNGTNVELLNFTIVTNSEVTFKNFPISLTASESSADQGLYNSTASAANFTDIKVMNVDEDDEFMSSVDVTSFTTTLGGALNTDDTNGDLTGYHIFTDEFTMEAGEELNLSLQTDIYNDSDLNNMTLSASLQLGSSYPEIRDVNNKVLTNTSSLVPSSAVSGKTMTVKSPALTMSLASTPVATTPTANTNIYVKGQSDVQFVGMVFDCGGASGCLIDDLNMYGAIDADGDDTGSFTVGVDTTNVSEVVGQVKLVDAEGETIADYANVATSTGLIQFEDMNWQLEAGESTIVYLVGDIKSDMSTDDIAFYVAAATDVTVYDDDQNTFNATGTPNKLTAGAVDTYVTVKAGGQLTIEVDSDTPDEDIIVAGATEVEVARFLFNTEAASNGASESFVVDTLNLIQWQEGAETADYDEYGENLLRLRIEYTDSNGDLVTDKYAYPSGGVLDFSEMDFYIEKDGEAELAVYADVNPSATATEGETINIGLALHEFEALSGSGQEKYYASKLDPDEAGAEADLDVGTITFVASGVQVGTADSGLTVGTIDTVTTADLNDTYPVGTMVKFGANSTTYTEASEPLLILTSKYTDGDTTMTGYPANVDTTGIEASDYVYYAFPGTGYLSETNAMYIYKSKPTLSVNTSSPSGSESQSATDDVFMVDVHADEGGKIKLRAGSIDLAYGAATDGVDPGANNTNMTTSATAGETVDGTSSIEIDLSEVANADTFSFDSTLTTITPYDRIGFWISWVDTDTGGSGPTFTDFKVNTNASATTYSDTGATQLTQTICGSDGASLETGEWYYCDFALPNTARYIHLEIDDVTGLEVDGDGVNAEDDYLFIDVISLYTEKLVVDVSSSALDSYANNGDNAGGPVAAILKMENGNTYATGYVALNDGGTTSATSAKIEFIPSTEIEIGAGDTETLTVETDTVELIAATSGDDIVTFSMDYGTSSTAGDLYWYETNATVSWVGDTSGTQLSGESIVY